MNKMKLIDASALEEHLYEEIRCGVLCTNTMRSDTGCDGGCHYDEGLLKKIDDTIQRCIEWQPAVNISSYTETMIVGGEKILIDPVSYEVGYSHGQSERPTGEWKYGNGNGECPFCGRERQHGWDNYCGYCGARMRE